MKMKRNSSTKDNIKKKVPKLDTEETADYTKLLTSEENEIIESGNEQELDISDKPEKIKSAKKSQAIKKKVLKTDKENGLKKTKGKPTKTLTGIHFLVII